MFVEIHFFLRTSHDFIELEVIYKRKKEIAWKEIDIFTRNDPN